MSSLSKEDQRALAELSRRQRGDLAQPEMTIIRRVNRPIWLWAGFAAVLEVPGRRTGTPIQVTLIPWEVDGTLYLMSQYGESDWVRNLRASGRGELRRKGRRQAFTAIEVDSNERDLVITAFIAKTPKPFRRDFDKRPGAADHPTFRVEPVT
jgi:deazaflavin-dependent oxidoreductase (nitroreductase family)